MPRRTSACSPPSLRVDARWSWFRPVRRRPHLRAFRRCRGLRRERTRPIPSRMQTTRAAAARHDHHRDRDDHGDGGYHLRAARRRPPPRPVRLQLHRRRQALHRLRRRLPWARASSIHEGDAVTAVAPAGLRVAPCGHRVAHLPCGFRAARPCVLRARHGLCDLREARRHDGRPVADHRRPIRRRAHRCDPCRGGARLDEAERHRVYPRCAADVHRASRRDCAADARRADARPQAPTVQGLRALWSSMQGVCVTSAACATASHRSPLRASVAPLRERPAASVPSHEARQSAPAATA